MSGRIEINPGEMFMVADRTILVTEYETVLGDVSKIGAPDRDIAYLLTFTGRVNRTQETDSVTVAMSPQDAWNLVGQVLHGLDLLAKTAKGGGDRG